jgi:NADPH:quinone reductase-like Zn-dependent oxidoreductase
MNWCREGIGAAIALAKAQGAVFVVVVRSEPGAEEEEAALLEAALQEEQVVARLAGMVCIEVVVGSTTCQQFAAIYPVMSALHHRNTSLAR